VPGIKKARARRMNALTKPPKPGPLFTAHYQERTHLIIDHNHFIQGLSKMSRNFPLKNSAARDFGGLYGLEYEKG